jgi:hypothetical protein
VKVELPVPSPGAESSTVNDSEISRCGKFFDKQYYLLEKQKKWIKLTKNTNHFYFRDQDNSIEKKLQNGKDPSRYRIWLLNDYFSDHCDLM